MRVKQSDIEALETIKEWTRPVTADSFPEPAFEIGDVVRIADNENPDELAVVCGLELSYLDHSRKHYWRYTIVDRVAVIGDFPADELEGATATTAGQAWHVTGGMTPVRPTFICFDCDAPRIRDHLDCPYCGAAAIPF